MDSKERMQAVMRGQVVDRPPVALHCGKPYKFSLARERGLDPARTPLEEIDFLMFETYLPDWLHLEPGDPRPGWADPHAQAREELLPAVRRLDSMAAIEDYCALYRLSPAQIAESGIYDHVKVIATRYGHAVFIAVNERNPVCDIFHPEGILGFEDGLVACHTHPDLVARLVGGLYEARLAHVEALAACRCDAYVGTEAFVAADNLSPEAFGGIILPAQAAFYSSVRLLGLEPFAYFPGDVVPILPHFGAMNISALLIQPSCKAFMLDVMEIRRELDARVSLFGNMDSDTILRFGTPETVRHEAARQLDCSQFGSFVLANGSPLLPGTPEANIRTLTGMVR